MKRVLLDTNVILRLLLADHEDQHSRAVRLFDAATDKECLLQINAEILAECTFVLESFYKVSRVAIAELMERLLCHPGIYSNEMNVLKVSLEHYCSSKVDIADCLLAARSRIQNCSIAAFDKDFKKLPSVDLVDF